MPKPLIRFRTAMEKPIDFWQLEVTMNSHSVAGIFGIMLIYNVDTTKDGYMITSPYITNYKSKQYSNLSDAKYACINHYFEMSKVLEKGRHFGELGI